MNAATIDVRDEHGPVYGMTKRARTFASPHPI
jgi:hypothetical protein